MDIGAGLSDSVGVAGFPNNEAFRAGSTYPKFTIPRLYVKQVIGFGGAREDIASDQLQFAETLDTHRLTITAGKLSVWDVFDDNKYAHDARQQFMNWVLVGNGAIDFAADARGYTDGIALDYNREHWAARLGWFQTAKEVNAKRLDDHILDAYQVLGELEERYALFDRAGKLRELMMIDRTRSITYQTSYDTGGPVSATDPLPAFRRYRVTYGVGLNAEQAITEDLGAFARLSWNPGRVQEFTFTEVDRHASLGLSLKAAFWDRPDDTVGVAGAINGLSDRHRGFYAAGNTGFIVGDGRLRYRPEQILETYYQLQVVEGFQLTADYQLVANPGYNADRGPISIFGFRAHAQF
jgi:high affinity Mn2+ porin